MNSIERTLKYVDLYLVNNDELMIVGENDEYRKVM